MKSTFRYHLRHQNFGLDHQGNTTNHGRLNQRWYRNYTQWLACPTINRNRIPYTNTVVLSGNWLNSKGTNKFSIKCHLFSDERRYTSPKHEQVDETLGMSWSKKILDTHISYQKTQQQYHHMGGFGLQFCRQNFILDDLKKI